jgi:hypothetical protein
MALETVKQTEDDPRFEDVKHALAPYKPESFHRLVPTALQERSPLYRPAVAVVKINAADARDVYDTPGGGGTVCLHTQALERIGNALGIDWLRTEYERDPKEPFFVTAHVTAEYTDAVGQRRKINASATSDLRDGSITADVLKGGLRTARQFIAERTEARARNRVVRKVTGMPTSFTKPELAKPFVAVRWRLDESDPDVKRALIAQGVGASDQIFGHQSEKAIEASAKVIDAGHEGPEAEIAEGQFTEQTEREPEVPDVAPAAAAATPAAPTGAEVQPIVTAIIKSVGRGSEAGTPADDDLIATLGVVLRDILGLKGKVSGSEMSAIRLSIAQLVFGTEIKTSRSLTRGQANALIGLSKELIGQANLKTLFAFALANDPALAEIKGK